MSTSSTTHPHQREREKAFCAVTEWDVPCGDGWENSAESVTAKLRADSAGELWIHMAIGDEWTYIRPETLKGFAQELAAMACSWANCHWDHDLRVCVSKICTVPQGQAHVGRLSPWQRARLTRRHGLERDLEILSLRQEGLSYQAIGEKVGWSTSTVATVLRSAQERGDGRRKA